MAALELAGVAQEAAPGAGDHSEVSSAWAQKGTTFEHLGRAMAFEALSDNFEALFNTLLGSKGSFSKGWTIILHMFGVQV